VQRVAGNEQEVAGLHPPGLVPDAEVHLAIQDDHDLVVVVLGVQGVAGLLDDGQVDGQELAVAQELALDRMVGGCRIRLQRPHHVTQACERFHVEPPLPARPEHPRAKPCRPVQDLDTLVERTVGSCCRPATSVRGGVHDLYWPR